MTLALQILAGWFLAAVILAPFVGAIIASAYRDDEAEKAPPYD